MYYDVVLVFCAHSSLQAETALCLNKLRSRSDLRWGLQIRSGDALISRSRSIEASIFLKSNASPFMLFIDDDILFTPDDVKKIVAALQQGAGVVAGMYPVADGSRLALNWTGGLQVNGHIQECKYVSTGFMGISQQTLIQVRDKLQLPRLHKDHPWADNWPFFEAGRSRYFPEQNWYVSEDWDFCEKVRAAGLKTWLHTGVMLGHKKSKVFLAQDTVQQPVEMAFNIIPDLKEFNGTDADKLYATNWRQRIADEFKEWTGDTQEFYKQNESYIYDLTLFNSAEGYRNGKLGPLRSIQSANVFDFGSGIGTVALMLARVNTKVVGFEFNNLSRRFAEFRRNKYSCPNLSFTDTLPDDLREFDYVVAVDVLEHIPDLRLTMAILSKRMRVGAKLYHADSFKDQYALHVDHSSQIDQILQEAGFVVWSENWAMKVK